ncbi:MAG: NusG domain II-containing protein [Desulfuromonadales bacterium]|jgi:hypothetical protein
MALTALLRRPTRLDYCIVLLLLLLTAASFSLHRPGAPGERVVAERDGRLVFSAPLAENRRVTLTGPLGETQLAIENGRARILASPCLHKTCMRMGEAMRTGDFIACVPNRLLVRIDGSAGERADYDLLSR